MYSSPMAVLHVFLPNDQLEVIKHMHIGLVVHCVASNLTIQAGILPFVESIEKYLAKARERHAHRKNVSGMCSYSLLVTNYWSVMALPTEPPFCLMYPTIYGAEAEDKTHFNTKSSPLGMCTNVCMCRSLLQLMDKDPANRRAFDGSHLIVPCDTQYKKPLSWDNCTVQPLRAPHQSQHSGALSNGSGGGFLPQGYLLPWLSWR